MRKLTQPGWILIMMTLPIVGCSTARDQPVARAAMEPRGTDEAVTPAADAETTALATALATALDRALAEGWRDLRILDECHTEAGWTTLEIFPNGVAIWNREAQFTLTRAEIRGYLEAFRELGFTNLAAQYGGRGSLAAPNESAMEVSCRVRLTLDGVTKEVVQLDLGEQSAELRRLAERLLALAEEPARGGVTASDLDDGFAKIAAGELAPEALELMLHAKRDAGGWLLRVVGTEASTRELLPEKGYGERVVLELPATELTELAAFMAEQGIGEMPINLYGEHYTDVNVRVLAYEKNIQARQFAGLTRGRHGELQARFDRLAERLAELHHRVIAQGRATE